MKFQQWVKKEKDQILKAKHGAMMIPSGDVLAMVDTIVLVYKHLEEQHELSIIEEINHKLGVK